MMIRHCLLLCLGLLSGLLCAQSERLLPLTSNNVLHFERPVPEAAMDRASRGIYYEADNFILTTDTLDIPFIDDFTENRTRRFNSEVENTSDTVVATGNCLFRSEIPVFETAFMDTPSYFYTWDSATATLDSTVKDSVVIYVYDSTISGDCFNEITDSIVLWPDFYKLLINDSTGALEDSVYQIPDTSIDVAELFISSLDTADRWFDNHAYINNTYPINPVTLGVATLDGLNRFGLPYNKAVPDAYGDADYLTSKPFRLGANSQADTVTLTFFYQAKGIGDSPEASDSLAVDFLDQISGDWKTVWAIPGIGNDSNAVAGFQRVDIVVPDQGLSIDDPKYFYDGFQFRFRNKASLAGNNDHWHIDYVKFEERPAGASAPITDIGLVDPFPNLLSEYEQMPWDHFDRSIDLVDTIQFRFRNINDQINPNTFWAFNSRYADDNTLFDSVPANTSNFFFPDPVISRTATPDADFVLPAIDVDEQVVEWRSIVFVNENADNARAANDSAIGIQRFGELLAYDDGSAERAYGLEGPGIKKFAYEFNLRKKDTLAGIQIHFSNIDVDIRNLVFNYQIWDEITLNDPDAEDSAIVELFNRTPYYIDSTNGFYNINLDIGRDTPLVLEGSIYVGWAQTDTRNMQIGYDLNSTKGHDHMFVNIGGAWKKSAVDVPGSPMIRLVLQGDYDVPTTSIREIVPLEWDLTLYPNPGRDRLYLKGDLAEGTEIRILNTIGALLMEENWEGNGLDVANLSAGIYLVYVADRQGRSKLVRWMKS